MLALLIATLFAFASCSLPHAECAPRLAKRTLSARAALPDKLSYFMARMDKLRTSRNDKWDILIDRSGDLFTQAYSQIFLADSKKLLNGINVTFTGEEASDDGGVRRELLTMLSKEFLRPERGLLQWRGEYVYLGSSTRMDHFQFLGKVMALALLEDVTLDIPFLHSVFNLILETKVDTRADLQRIDPELFKHLQYLMRPDVNAEDLGLDFTYMGYKKKKKRVIDLKPNGSRIPVTEENKAEYVGLYAAARTKVGFNLKTQAEHLVLGFHSLVPLEELKRAGFIARNLDLVIVGRRQIDLSYLQDSGIVQFWSEVETGSRLSEHHFWNYMGRLSQEGLRQFFNFATGSPRVPFDYLRIVVKDESERLPTSNTCAKTVYLPNYKKFQTFSEKMDIALRESRGFDDKAVDNS